MGDRDMSDQYYHSQYDDSIFEEEDDDSSKKVNDKDVYSSDGTEIGNVKASLSDFIIVKSEENDLETRYSIPRIELERIDHRSITLRSKKKDIEQKYPKSQFKEVSHYGKRKKDDDDIHNR